MVNRALIPWVIFDGPRGQAVARGEVRPGDIQTFLIQTLRGSIVRKTSDNTFSELRITRAYIKLLCIPDGETRMVSLVQIGNYEIRMLDAAKADTSDGPLFLIELFDHDAQSSVDSCVCDDIEAGVAAFEAFGRDESIRGNLAPGGHFSMRHDPSQPRGGGFIATLSGRSLVASRCTRQRREG